MTKRMLRRICSGFTLIELLVVVSIIALLVSILLPALGRAREMGRLSACVANMHQIVVAANIYILDNGDFFYEYRQGEAATRSPAYRECGQGGIPANENVQPGHPDYNRLINLEDWRPINEFVDSYELWQCPSDRGREEFTAANGYTYPAVKPNNWSDPYAGSSYWFNTAGIPKYWNTGQPNGNLNIGNNAGRIRYPALFVVFYEPTMYEVNTLPLQEGAVPVSGYIGMAGAANYHEPFFDEPSSVTGFADGHAQRVKDIQGAGGGNAEFTLVPDYGTRVTQ